MTTQSFAVRLLSTTSTLALSAAAFLASLGTPASAQATSGIYAAGSTLASLVFRQIFDCYTGATVGGDGVLLPTTCTVVSTVQGMVAGVGSGNGMRGYISNRPEQWFAGAITPTVTWVDLLYRRGTIIINTTTNVAITTPFPAGQPPFVDSSNSTNFGNYPYPRLDIALSEAPLPWAATSLTTTSFSFNPATGWSTAGGSITSITLNSTTQVATYATTVYGNPIQVPAFEINVAIAVNVNSPSFQINSQIKDVNGNIVPGGAIQLTAGQLCAIFSGLVTDWNSTNWYTYPNTPVTIPYLDHSGTQHTTGFNYANGNILQPYSTTSLPITVVYNVDESGESYILTNYLHAVCPLLDPNNTYKYISIFAPSTAGTKPLPSTSFADLITNIVAARGNGPWNATMGAQWRRVVGSGGMAATISTGSAQAGYIGYVGANFTKPYAQTVSGAGLTNVEAPYSAALENESMRGDVPNTTGTSLTFIAPTPRAADAAWNDTRLQSPQTTWTWADYNIYNNTFTTTVTQDGVALFGQSVLPLTNRSGAYPLSGATFLDLYSCYNVQTDVTRQANLVNFLAWYMDSPLLVQKVVQNNGFHLLPVNYSSNIVTQYLIAGQPGYISAAKRGTQSGGCTSVPGGGGAPGIGANGGAK